MTYILKIKPENSVCEINCVVVLLCKNGDEKNIFFF